MRSQNELWQKLLSEHQKKPRNEQRMVRYEWSGLLHKIDRQKNKKSKKINKKKQSTENERMKSFKQVGENLQMQIMAQNALSVKWPVQWMA